MALERYVKPVDEKEEKRVKSKRKFWTKKKILTVVLIAIILAGFYPIGHWPIWLIIFTSLAHGMNPIWTLQMVIQTEMEYRVAQTRKIEVVIAKGDEIKKMTPCNYSEVIVIMRKNEQINPLYEKMLEADKIERKAFGEYGVAISDNVVFEGDTVKCSRFLLFKKPLAVWTNNRVLAIKILVVNDYGRDWPRNIFHIDFILLKPIKVSGLHVQEWKYITVEVIAVGYSCTASRAHNATVSKSIGGWDIGNYSIDFPAGVYKYFSDFDQGKTYTLIIPFAELLKDNYVIGIRPTNMDVKVLEIGYTKP